MAATVVEVDESALHHTTRPFLDLIPQQTRLMAVVKSNAYGHGMVQTAQSLVRFALVGTVPWLPVSEVKRATESLLRL